MKNVNSGHLLAGFCQLGAPAFQLHVFSCVKKEIKQDRTVVCETRLAEAHEQVLLYFI